LVTPPIEEAHDRPLMVYLMMILLQSIQNSCHYFGELLEQKEEKYKTKMLVLLPEFIKKKMTNSMDKQIAYTDKLDNSLSPKNSPIALD